MKDKTRRKYIGYLVKLKFPWDIIAAFGPHSAEDKKQVADTKSYVATLKAMSDLALEELFNSEATLHESKRFYNEPRAQADFSFWVKAAYWSPEEAIPLLLGKDPRIVNRDRMIRDEHTSLLRSEWDQLQEFLWRAQRVGDLDERHIRPKQLAEWALKYELPCPTELQEALERYADSPASVVPTAKRNREIQEAANNVAKQWKSERKQFGKRDICNALFNSSDFNQMFKSVETIERIVKKQW